MKRSIKTIFASLLVLVSVNTLIAEEAKKLPHIESTKVAPGIYMLSGVGGFTGGNIGLSIGEDGVVLIDDSMPPFLDNMNKAIKMITNKPIDFLINTHVHGDHTGNNESLGKKGVKIVAHENVRNNMIAKGKQAAGKKQPIPKTALPVITFSNSMDFHLNGEDARVFHVDNAHTDGDAVIQFKNANVIHTGDTFFNGLFPYIDLNNGGGIKGYISAQKKILALSDDRTKIIPGHGPLSNKKQLQASLDMLVDSKKLVSDLINKGLSEDEVAKAEPLKKYGEHWSWEFITTEKMTRQIYESLKNNK